VPSPLHLPCPYQASRPGSDQATLVGFLSSHLGRWPHRRRDWFAALATMCRDLLPYGSVLLDAPRTTAAQYVRRCAALFGHSTSSVATDLVPRADRDRLLVESANTIVVLSARPGSRTESLLKTTLTRRPESDATWYVAQLESLVPARLFRRCRSRGARPFLPVIPPITASRTSHRSPPWACLKRIAHRDWLVHCTRESSGRWPGEQIDEYHDNLILGRPEADHSAVATLGRILSQRRIRAVSRPVEGHPRAVSFTACGLDQLHALRRFRPHRGRWDFEPYGLAIAREWLQARGTCEVTYRPSDQLESPGPFQQPISSGRSGRLEWRHEREWRHPGHVELSELDADDGIVLIRDPHEREQLPAGIPWPVLALDHSDGGTSKIQ